jgi:hypothetical protein
MNPIAYLDPGSGSMIIQLILGGAAAVAVGAKFYWKRFLSFLGIGKTSEEQARR